MGRINGWWKPSTLYLIWFAVGVVLIYLGEEYALARAAESGAALLGLWLVAVGVAMILKKLGVFRVDGWASAHVVDTYRALADLLWGFVFIGAGFALAASMVMDLAEPGSAGVFWSGILGSSSAVGVILSGGGLIVAVNGLIRTLAGSGRADPRQLGGLSFLLDRLAGAATLLLGTALSAVGLMLLMAPSFVTALLGKLASLITGP